MHCDHPRFSPSQQGRSCRSETNITYRRFHFVYWTSRRYYRYRRCWATKQRLGRKLEAHTRKEAKVGSHFASATTSKILYVDSISTIVLEIQGFTGAALLDTPTARDSGSTIVTLTARETQIWQTSRGIATLLSWLWCWIPIPSARRLIRFSRSEEIISP